MKCLHSAHTHKQAQNNKKNGRTEEKSLTLTNDDAMS